MHHTEQMQAQVQRSRVSRQAAGRICWLSVMLAAADASLQVQRAWTSETGCAIAIPPGCLRLAAAAAAAVPPNLAEPQVALQWLASAALTAARQLPWRARLLWPLQNRLLPRKPPVVPHEQSNSSQTMWETVACLSASAVGPSAVSPASCKAKHWALQHT